MPKYLRKHRKRYYCFDLFLQLIFNVLLFKCLIPKVLDDHDFHCIW